MPMLYLLLFLSFGFNDNISIMNNVSIGHDSNPMKLSDNEISESNDNFLGKYSVSTSYIKINTRLKSSLSLLKRKTKVEFSFKTNYYADLNEKSNYGVYLKINQPIGNYQYIKFNYTFIPDIFLREYVDGDYIHQYFDFMLPDNSDPDSYSYQCYFNLSKISFQYQRPLSNRKNKISFILNQESQFYNNLFTEFDLKINGIKVLYNKSNTHNNYSLSYEHGSADNLTMLDGNVSTSQMDRGYDENKINISYSHKFKLFSVGAKMNNVNREYSSTIFQDELHLNRKHVDSTFSFWFKFKINNLTHKLVFSNRKRDTKSPETWVEDLKTFNRYDMSYTVFFKKISFGGRQ